MYRDSRFTSIFLTQGRCSAVETSSVDFLLFGTGARIRVHVVDIITTKKDEEEEGALTDDSLTIVGGVVLVVSWLGRYDQQELW